MRQRSSVSARERTCMLGFLFLYLAVWILYPIYGDPVIPSDNLEQLIWALHPAWGYPKHPPFPTWVLWVFQQVFPTGAVLTYVLGGLQVSIMLVCAWLIGRRMLDERRAWCALLLVSCITYYMSRLGFYNHNTTLLALYAVSLCCLWRAVRSTGFLWWIALGACWGIGMLCKYQMVLPIACNLAFLWTARSLGLSRLLRGAAVASITAGVIFAPHVVWLIDNNGPSVSYALDSVTTRLGFLARINDVVGFLASQAWRMVPAAVLAGVFHKQARKAGGDLALAPEPDALVRSFLSIHAWGPLALMSALSLLAGIDLMMHWGTAFLWMIPLWFLGTVRGRGFGGAPVPRALFAATVVQLIVLVAYLATGHN